MFEKSGFQIVQEIPRVFQIEKDTEILKAISYTTAVCGVDPDVAIRDALPLQYVVKAIPS